MRKKILLHIVFTCLAVLLPGLMRAQVTPVYSQYLMNPLVINPGYTGTRGNLSTSLSYRTQWAGIEGAPSFQSFTAHAPLKNDRVGLGLMIHNMSFGKTDATRFYGQYSFHIHLNKGRLVFGLKGGVDLTNTNLTGLLLQDDNDPAFTEGVSSYMLPNFGFGTYYYTNKVFIGLSVPEFLSYREASSRNNYEFYHDISNYKISLIGGGLITASSFFRIKPSFLVQYHKGLPLRADLNMNFILGDLVWLGGSYRLGEEAFVGIFELQVSPQFKLGYAYDYAFGRLNSFVNGTHEVILRYEFGYKLKASNPRYF